MGKVGGSCQWPYKNAGETSARTLPILEAFDDLQEFNLLKQGIQFHHVNLWYGE